jgi:hypothetical protein
MRGGYGVAAAKCVLLCLPSLVLQPLVDLRAHRLWGGFSFILGVLLQALIPPRKKGLLLLLTFAVGFTIAYSMFWK